MFGQRIQGGSGALEVGRVQMSDPGIAQHLGQEIRPLSPILGERWVCGVIDLFGVPDEVDDRALTRCLRHSRRFREWDGEKRGDNVEKKSGSHRLSRGWIASTETKIGWWVAQIKDIVLLPGRKPRIDGLDDGGPPFADIV